MNVAYLCLGGNLGDRAASLKTAIDEINKKVGEVDAISHTYETEAWGVINQQAYLNVCLELKTKLNPEELIENLLNIESDLGRKRDVYHTYEPRTIDLDILFFNDEMIDLNHLVIPHPRLHLRKFVLIPLNDIAPNHVHPVFQKTIVELLNECQDMSDVKLI
jgi:2-amino-4-hydroxy-6-hydroxymethyldihydropteridine diphosphokinase